MIEKYGKEKDERLFYTPLANESVRSSWECRDCTALDTNEYHEKLRQRDEIIGTEFLTVNLKETKNMLGLLM